MIRPEQFTESGWAWLLPFLERQTEGGITIIAVEVLPTQNWPSVSVGSFDKDARRRLKAALTREKKRATTE